MDSLQTPRNITSLDELCYGGMNAANYIYIYSKRDENNSK